MEKVVPSPPAEGPPPYAALRKIRIPFIQRASVAVGGRREELFLIDLSLLGVFIERTQPLARGDEVEVSFTLPGNEIAVHARCRVAWFRPPGVTALGCALPSGVGVEFLEMSDGDRERLQRHLLDYLRQHPRHRRFLRHPEEVEEEA